MPPRNRLKSHKDVEFHVQVESNNTEVFETWDEAAARACTLAVNEGSVKLDVVVFSAAGAEWFMGEEGRKQYEEDPDASVFERIVVKANAQGRVP